ncbi:MAG: GNAT family N-acetyltransferase [Pseudomonadota bacterium]
MTERTTAPGQTHAPSAVDAGLVPVTPHFVPVVETARLRLHCPTAEHVATLIAEYGKPRTRYMGGPFSAKEAWLSIGADTAGWLYNGFGYWSVTDRATGALVGSVGLGHPPDYAERELGWFVLEAAEGHGFAREAAAAARDHAFETLGFSTLVSYIDRDNARSIRVAEALGAEVDPTAVGPDPEDLVYRHRTGAAR